MNTTRAIRFTAPGGPEVMRLETIELPEPAPGQVQIRHTVIGLNFQEVYQRSGVYKMPSPSGLGSEAAGAVEKLDASAGAVFALVVKGVLKPNINARYALADVARAHADLETGRTVGASLLIP